MRNEFEWNPSKKQFDAFLEKEVQHAFHNIVILKNDPAFTLHSLATITKVRASTRPKGFNI